MPRAVPHSGGRKGRIAFLREFLRNPREVASVIPSSRFLERRIVATAEIPSSSIIVELGTGTGGTARAILRAMKPRAQLLSIEINPRFCDGLQRLADDRLVVHCGSAAEIAAALKQHDLPAPDVVISGIPFSTIGPKLGREILREVHSVLAPGGRFVAYQLSRQVEELAQPIFGSGRTRLEMRNIPPLRISRWEKRKG